jgi:hypothetical protein
MSGFRDQRHYDPPNLKYLPFVAYRKCSAVPTLGDDSDNEGLGMQLS